MPLPGPAADAAVNLVGNTMPSLGKYIGFEDKGPMAKTTAANAHAYIGAAVPKGSAFSACQKSAMGGKDASSSTSWFGIAGSLAAAPKGSAFSACQKSAMGGKDASSSTSWFGIAGSLAAAAAAGYGVYKLAESCAESKPKDSKQ